MTRPVDGGELTILGLKADVEIPQVLRWIREDKLAGIFLFGEILTTRDGTRELVAELQAAASLPLIIVIDQEGGRVQEWGPPHLPRYPSPREMGADSARGEDLEEWGRRIGTDLIASGINTNFAPVFDVDSNPENPIIGNRSFGTTPEAVATNAVSFARGLRQVGVAACAKHFPGHGDTETDSHLCLPVVRHDRDRLESIEIVPFRAAVRADVEMIMTAHVLYPALDPENPATISRPILQGLLREDLGYDGIVVTDDLQMRGIRDRLDLADAGLAALVAGCDLLLAAREHERHGAFLQTLTRALRDKTISPEQAASSRHRVERLRARWAAR